jgi:hypothetical protein
MCCGRATGRSCRCFPLVSVQHPAAHTPGGVLRSHVGSEGQWARAPVAGRVRARGTLLHPPSLLRRLVKREGKEGPSLLGWVGLGWWWSRIDLEPDPFYALSLGERGDWALATRSTRFRYNSRVACQFPSRWLFCFFNGDVFYIFFLSLNICHLNFFNYLSY